MPARASSVSFCASVGMSPTPHSLAETEFCCGGRSLAEGHEMEEAVLEGLERVFDLSVRPKLQVQPGETIAALRRFGGQGSECLESELLR